MPRVRRSSRCRRLEPVGSSKTLRQGSRSFFPHLRDPRLDESLHQGAWHRLVESESDRPFPRCFVSGEFGRQSLDGLLANGVEAAVSFPSGVPDEGFAIDTQGGHAVTESFGGARSRRANGGGKTLHMLACVRGKRREVGLHLRPGLLRLVPR